jgi:hypothetical protein
VELELQCTDRCEWRMRLGERGCLVVVVEFEVEVEVQVGRCGGREKRKGVGFRGLGWMGWNEVGF